MSQLFHLPRQVLLNGSVQLLAGAKATFYQTGTVTPQNVYTTSALSVAHSNPVVADANGVFPAVWFDPTITAYKVTITNAADALIYTEDPISETFTQAQLGAIENPRTATEIAAGMTPTNFAYPATPEDVRRWGAVDTGGASNSTTGINNTFSALDAGAIKGGGVVSPGDANSVYNISAPIIVPARAAGDNHTRWYSFKGMGRGAPRIIAQTGLANAPMVNANGQDSATFSFYREFKDLYLNGNSIAQHGLDLQFNQHFKVENVFINNLAKGTGTALNTAGIRVFGAISAQFRDVKIHNTTTSGIVAPSGSGNFFNANLVEGCSFLDLEGDGFYASGGWSGCAHVGNTHEFCDNYGMRLAGFSGTCGVIAGNYFESNGHGDIFIGEDTTANNVVVTGNYLNGFSAGVSLTDYTPIRVKFCDGGVILGNMVAQTTKSTTGFLLLDANIAGGSVVNLHVMHNQVRSLGTAIAPNTIYNLPGSWVDFGNSVIDPIFAPLICNNINRGRLPYGGWSISLAGGGTAARGAAIAGASSIRLVRPTGPDTSSISQVFTVGPEFKNRFVTVAVPILANAASQSITVAISPNGTSPQTTTIDVNTLGVNAQRIAYAMGFAPADATTITVTITANSAGADFTVGDPCLYVGARQWYSAATDQDWTNNTAPTTGTWVRGDRVWRSDSTASSHMGFVCTASGTPGTWKNMPNLAA